MLSICNQKLKKVISFRKAGWVYLQGSEINKKISLASSNLARSYDFF